MNFVWWRNRSQLPKEPGVYWAYSFWRLLYVGESGNMNERFTDNYGYGSHHKTSDLKRMSCTHICYRVIKNKHRRLHEEAIEITRKRPLLNKRKESPNKWFMLSDDFEKAAGIVLAALLIYYLLNH
jgi:excinuclease UvrABC nuclease subunit